jgi:HopA1 effector protein family
MTDGTTAHALSEIARSVWISNDEAVVRLEDGILIWPGASDIVSQATQAIYAVCYTGAKRRILESSTDAARDWLVEEIMTSVRPSQELDWAWCIEQVYQDGAVRARRGGRLERFSSGEYLVGPDADEHHSFTGERIGVPTWSGVFDSFTQSVLMRHRYLGIPGKSQEVRVYLNVKSAGVVDLLQRLSNLLVTWDIPFNIKCPAKRSLLERKDAVVLYLDRRNFVVACNLLFGVLGSMEDHFVDEVPLFAHRIARGVAFAESPHDGNSFGMSRSEVCAHGLVEAARQNNTIDTRMACMLNAIVQAGLSIERPHLNPGSQFPYPFQSY